MDSLRIPKRRASVEALLLDGSTGHFELFLGSTSQRHVGEERLVDLLVARDQFLPAIEQGRDELTWLNTTNVIFVRASREADPEPEVETIPTEVEVQLVLQTGARLRGLVGFLKNGRL